MSEPKGPHLEPEISGWLYKWTNYLKGYQKRWFVLSNGLLSYYRNQEEMRHTCRGSVSLQNAIITPTDHCSFIITGGNQAFHIRATTEKERQTWLTALSLAKKNRPFDSEDEDDIASSGESLDADTANLNKSLASKLEELQACNDVLPKHWSALQRSLTEIENIDGASGSVNIKELKERAILFRITSSAMVNKGLEFNDFAQTNWKKWQKALQHERDQRQRLEEMVEQLARQHSHLERAAARQVTSGDEDEEFEFFDAQEDEHNDEEKREFVLHSQAFTHRRNESNTSQEASGSSSEAEAEEGTRPPRSRKAVPPSTSTVAVSQGKRIRRTRVPDKPYHPLNLWSIMKNCIGKELSKIPMPVNFSEPLSMLQRLTEDYEYAAILDKAAKCPDSCEQLAYVAAFTVSSYSTTAYRTAKPFNPLLGETYECDRMEDLGWRSVSEQVSHHPPMFAQYCEGKQWTAWQEFTMASKFRGKYLQVIPLGISHLTFNNTKNHYTWRKVTTTVHNIIVGKLWVDQHGDMDITNHGTGDVCHLTFLPYSYFNSGNQRKVKGFVKSASGEVKWVLSGTWDQKIEIAPVLSSSGDPNNPTFKTGAYSGAWEVNPPNPGCEKFYNFSLLACQLNEPEENVAPTDSRLRPDQRLMEEGDWNGANDEKVRLEEKQRAARRNKEASGNPHYEPVWFRHEADPVTGGTIHKYTQEYWDCKSRQDWVRCPDIF